MRFMFIVHGPEDFGRTGPPPQALYEAIDKLAEEAFKSGKLVSMGGLRPTSQGARIRSTGGKLVMMDGPFTEAKEVIGGFSIFDLASKEEALQAARDFMDLHIKHWPTWEGECEIRQLYEESQQPDFLNAG